MKLGGHVLLADDHPLSREGLAMAARMALPGSAIVNASTVAEAVAATEARYHWRMILLDLQLPDARGYSGLLALQYRTPGTPIVIVTAYEDTMLIEAARALGAAGYVFKTTPLDTIAGRLRRVDAGESAFPEGTTPNPLIAAARSRIASLSAAQRDVLMALADGRSNKQIAHALDVTEATVKAHMTAIFRKMGVTNRAQALLAIQPLTGSLAA